eukprot:snap_masked-scaffold_47-processed-gene-1.84-mRNA-1 protein AED:1.00 eAED:1.00 QI:0/0/0/0/1/1/2/0/69
MLLSLDMYLHVHYIPLFQYKVKTKKLVSPLKWFKSCRQLFIFQYLDLTREKNPREQVLQLHFLSKLDKI